MNDFLPCPFCGGTSISIDRLDTGDPKYPDFVAQCFDCGASTGTHSEETFAAEAWDKRAVSKARVALDRIDRKMIEALQRPISKPRSVWRRFCDFWEPNGSEQ